MRLLLAEKERTFLYQTVVEHFQMALVLGGVVEEP